MFFEDIQSSSAPKIAVVGCGCSTATEPVAEISHHWNISQVSLTLTRECAAKGSCSWSVCWSVGLSVCRLVFPYVFSRTVAEVDTKFGYMGMFNGGRLNVQCGFLVKAESGVYQKWIYGYIGTRSAWHSKTLERRCQRAVCRCINN